MIDVFVCSFGLRLWMGALQIEVGEV